MIAAICEEGKAQESALFSKEGEQKGIPGQGREIFAYQLATAYYGRDFLQFPIEWYEKLLPDIIGHGASVNAKKGDSLDEMSGWIKEILDREGVRKIHITGVSLGAVLAQDFANHYPDRVKSLACFGGYDINHFDPSMQKENGSAQEEFYRLNLHFPKKSFFYLATLNRMVNVCKTDGRSYPLLIGCGEHDIPMEKEAVKRWAESEPDCTVKIFAGAGHCVNMDAPQAFHDALESFWQGKHM